MRLGFLVTQTIHANKIIDMAKAALRRGHSLSIFMTDDGVSLVRNSGVTDLRKLENVEMSLCDHSAHARHIVDQDIPEGIIKGTQYQNSLMHNEADKVLIF